MANANELKNSLDGMRSRLQAEAAELHVKLDEILATGDAAAKDLASKAKEAANNLTSHLEAFFQTALVAADATPMRGSVPVAGSPLAGRAAQPVRMSGVPATPPAAADLSTGPAITHDDVGHVDPMTRQSHAAPAAIGDESHEVGENGTEGPLADQVKK